MTVYTMNVFQELAIDVITAKDVDVNTDNSLGAGIPEHAIAAMIIEFD